MKLAEASRVKLEEFFREQLNDKNFQLPSIYFHAGKFSAALTLLLKIHGITVGKNIFVTPEFLDVSEKNKSKINVELAAHEIAHVLQYKREGFVSFFYKYFTGYAQNLRVQKSWNADGRMRAYLNIPFEIEARETAAKFVEWNRSNGKRKTKNGKY